MLKELQNHKAEQQISVYVHLYHGLDADAYERNYHAGKEPDQSPYGFHLAREEGFRVTFSKDIRGKLQNILRRLVLRVLGLDVLHAFSNRHQIRTSDAVWTMTEPEAFSVAALMALRIVKRRPIIANAVWLLNGWKNLSFLRRCLLKHLSKYFSILTVHSKACLPVVQAIFPETPTKLTHFGINVDLFQAEERFARDKGRPIRLFCPGNDSTRDWETLLAACGDDPRFEIVIACSWFGEERAKKYSNVSLFNSREIRNFVHEYQLADCVVIPMKENIFSGITVALEAAAMGSPILSTRTGGVPTYFSDDEVLYAPVADPLKMREALLEMDFDGVCERAIKAKKTLFINGYTTKSVIKEYTKITLSLLAAKDRLADIKSESL